MVISYGGARSQIRSFKDDRENEWRMPKDLLLWYPCVKRPRDHHDFDDDVDNFHFFWFHLPWNPYISFYFSCFFFFYFSSFLIVPHTLIHLHHTLPFCTPIHTYFVLVFRQQSAKLLHAIIPLPSCAIIIIQNSNWICWIVVYERTIVWMYV